MDEAIDDICSIGMAITDDAASIMSSGCIFVAGLHTKDKLRRTAILEMLGIHKERTGFPLVDFRIELHAHWAKVDQR